jgi:hypothetical protein
MEEKIGEISSTDNRDEEKCVKNFIWIILSAKNHLGGV